jgi:quinol monooxygenase YgiN
MMTPVGRYVKITANRGQGDALAAEMLGVAHSLREATGCELYLINRAADDPDVIWVTEQWQSQDALDAALQSPDAAASIGQVRELMGDGGVQRVDVEPLGGAGSLVGETGFAIVNLEEVEDLAPRFGFGEMGEARFACTPLGAIGVGISLQRLRPGVRQSFGHSHHSDEEVYVVLQGAGRVAIDDEVREVRAMDAIRVAPGCTRAFEAGPEGLEFLAMGAHHAGDAQVRPGFWAE